MWLLPSHTPSRTDRPRPARIAGALAAAGLLVAGCGGDSDDSGAGDAGSAAGDAGSAAAAAGCAPGETSGGREPGDAPTVPTDPAGTFDAAIDRTRELSSVVLTYGISIDGPYGSQDLSIDGALDSAGASAITAEADQDGETQATSYCSDGDTGWVRFGADSVVEAMPDGTSWVEAPKEELENLGVVYDMEAVWDVLPVLRGVTSVEDQGTRDIAGVPVRVVSGEVDYQAALNAASAEEEERLVGTISADPEADYHVEVGLDGAGVVRFLDVTVDAEVAPSEGEDPEQVGLGITMEMRSADPTVGVPTPPPAEETVPLADVPEVREMLSA